ncbi:MAG: FecR domain-containing protein [Spirochaetes bacterium]|nr:FecR domain-containing protein [Spirochaetota bacterium]
MKKTITALILLFILTIPVFAGIRAVVKETKGRVEIKLPFKNWQRARKGMVVPKNAVISTGFRSSAVISMGRTILQVKQLTRLKLQELIEKEGTVSTSLFLRIGKIRATVKSAKGVRQNFKLKSPVSTAAVRGTDFDYDGVKLQVYKGVVQFFNLLSQRRDIGAGEESETHGYTTPGSGEDGRLGKGTVNPSATGGGEGPGGITSGPGSGDFTGGIVIHLK